MKWYEIPKYGILLSEEELKSNSNLAKIVSLNAGKTESTPKVSSSEPEINQRKAVKDCCVDCPLKGLCDDDDCGRKLFRLFTK